jgi:pimeloyl-ACP methyl ester carboxylesterase
MEYSKVKRRALIVGLMTLIGGFWLPLLDYGWGFCQVSEEATAQVVNSARFEGKLSQCRLPGLDEEVLCGRYQVYEDRAARKGRKINLKIVVLPAKTDKVAPDPMVYLAGGGVLPATEYAPFFARRFANLRQQRDILLVDQRGTGESNPLPCNLPTALDRSELFDEVRYLEAIRRCRKELESKADLRFYTTPIAMDDLDEVRQWLGYPQLNLYGMSYGTKAAQVYLRQHPTRVRAIAMHGVVPLNTSMWSDTPRLAQEALDRVFDLCSGQAKCREAFPNLKQEFGSLLERLSEKPVKVKVEPPNAGQQMEITFNDQSVREFVYGTMSSANAIRTLPLMLHLAYQGNYQPLAQRLIPGGRGVPRGVFLSIACGEAISLIDPNGIREAAANTFMGESHLRRLVRTCQEWSRGWLPKNFWTPVKSTIPVLILTGALDHTTPPRYGDSVARTLPNARHLVLPNRSHNDVDPCVAKLIEEFVIRGKAEGLDASCAVNEQGLIFVTDLDAMRKP